MLKKEKYDILIMIMRSIKIIKTEKNSKRGKNMEQKEIKKLLNSNYEVVENLWRSL